MEAAKTEIPRTVQGFALLVAGMALLVYLPAVSTTLYWFDSAEFVNTARLLDVPHPPGYPLYNLIAALAVRVPVGEIPQRVNALSALFSAAALGLFFLVIWVHTRRTLAALLGVVILGSSARFVEMSLVAEVYPLEILLYMACFLHLSRDRSDRVAMLYALLGLLVSHRLTNVFFAIAAIHLTGWSRLRSRDALWLGLGALPYLHTAWVFFFRPVPAHGLWAINYFDYPRNLETFLRVITGTLYASHLHLPDAAREIEEMGGFLQFLEAQVGMVPAALGLGAMFFRSAPLEIRLAVLFNAGFFLHYDVLEKDTMYFPSLVGVLALFLILLVRILESPRLHSALGGVILVTALALAGHRGFATMERMNATDLESVERCLEGAAVQLPPRTLFMVTDDTLLHPMVHLILIEKKRPDLALHIVEHYTPSVRVALAKAVGGGLPVMSPLFLPRAEMDQVRRDFHVVPEGPYYILEGDPLPLPPLVDLPAYPTLWGETMMAKVASSHRPLRAGDHIRVRVTMTPAAPRVMVFRLGAPPGRSALTWVFPFGYQGRPSATEGSSTEDYLLTLPPEVLSWDPEPRAARLEIGLLPSVEIASERGYIAIEPAPESESEIFKGRAGASREALEQGIPFHEPIYRYRRGELAYSELVTLDLAPGPR